jgi:hypothetical protein
VFVTLIKVNLIFILADKFKYKFRPDLKKINHVIKDKCKYYDKYMILIYVGFNRLVIYKYHEL